MKLSIISSTSKILSAEKFEKIIIMTESGEITILPGHEPLLSAIRPGILSVEYYLGNKIHTAEYATGGWVLNISPSECLIVADVIESGDALSDLDYIAAQKKEAADLVKAYKDENGTTIDPKKLIELENQLLRYTAMHELGKKWHITHGGRH
jgi:F-type H+-transporting ATPase subunit epsilon